MPVRFTNVSPPIDKQIQETLWSKANDVMAEVLRLKTKASYVANNEALHRRTADALVISLTNTLFLSLVATLSIAWVVYTLSVARAARKLVESQGVPNE